MHAEYWPYAVDAVRLVRYLSEIENSPLQHLRVSLDVEPDDYNDVEEYRQIGTMAKFRNLQSFSWTTITDDHYIGLYTRLEFTSALQSVQLPCPSFVCVCYPILI
eukprot:1862645-Rhodomonas_salina.1